MDGGEFEDLQLAFAAGGDYGSHVADLLADEGAPDGGCGGDEAVGDVGFFAGDELVLDFFFFGVIEDEDGGAEGDFVVRDIGEVDEGELGHAFFELSEACVDEFLALLGHVVFGVFAEVAEGGGFFDLGWELVSELMLQLLNVFEKFFLDVFRHRKSSVAARGEGRSGNGDVRAAAGVLFIIREGGKWGGREGGVRGEIPWVMGFGGCGVWGDCPVGVWSGWG